MVLPVGAETTFRGPRGMDAQQAAAQALHVRLPRIGRVGPAILGTTRFSHPRTSNIHTKPKRSSTVQAQETRVFASHDAMFRLHAPSFLLL